MSTQTIADDLKAARALVNEGWCQGDLADAHGGVCAIGALNLICVGSVYISVGGYPRRDAAVDALKRLLMPGQYLHEFNDASTTTQQDVLSLFDKALAELGALA